MSELIPHIDCATVEHSKDGIRALPREQPVGDKTYPKVKALFEDFESLPVLNISGTGRTGYIDFITPEQMTGDIMRGVDDVGRPFVAFLLMEYGELTVETIFRRYRSGGDIWTSGGGSNLTSGALTDKDLEFIARLIAGEECEERMFKDHTIKLV